MQSAGPLTAVPGPRFERLTPVSPLFATLPILEGFTWDDCFAPVEAGEWYLVVFRSIRRPDADLQLLTEYDDRAYDEALANRGLLYYFKGELNERCECLSFCVWNSREQARASARLPQHAQAAALVRQMYESYTLERYLLVKRPGADAVETIPVT